MAMKWNLERTGKDCKRNLHGLNRMNDGTEETIDLVIWKILLMDVGWVYKECG